MKQTIEIEVPAGYKAKYNLETQVIELVKIDRKPTTWKEYRDQTNPKEQGLWYLDGYAPIKSLRIAYPEYAMEFTSKEDAFAFVALMKLRLLRKAWVGDWEPDYASGKCENWHIHYWGSRSYPEVDYCTTASRPLSFPTQEMAKEFKECFAELLKQARPLL